MAHMIEFVKRRIAKKPDTAGVIYTYKRDLCNELAGELRGAGVDATPYHGGLSKGDRESVLRGWTDKKVRAIACGAHGRRARPDLPFLFLFLFWGASVSVRTHTNHHLPR